MARTLTFPLTRRSMLVGASSVCMTLQARTSVAQTVTDPDMTDLLRNGLQPRAEPSYPSSPGNAHAPPPPKPPISTIPSPGSVRARQDEIEVHVVIDPAYFVDLAVRS